MDNQMHKQMEHAYNLIKQAHKEMARIWWQAIIFSWEWWLGSPLIPLHQPWNTSLLPVTVMLFIQYKPNLIPFIKAVFLALGKKF